MMHLAPLIILSLISAIGVIGNLFIIGSICLYKRLRVRGNAFLINLAIADLIIVAYIMPVGLATSQFEQNPFGLVLCEVNAFLTMTSCGVSTQTLMLIALERYFHICKMHLYRKAFTPKLIGLYIFIIWVYTAAWTCQGWTGWTKFVYGESAYVCIFSAPFAVSYAICLSVFGMIIPIIVLGVCYYKIFMTVVRSRRAISAHRKNSEKKSDMSRLTRPESEKQAAREYRLIITLFTIVLVFIICWLPATLVLALSPLNVFPSVAFTICIWMAMCNSSMNSFVYGILNKNFRTGYKQLLKHLLCCTLYNGKARCTHCQALLDDKDESSISEQRQSGHKNTKISVGPYSQTDSTCPKSLASESDCLDATNSDTKSPQSDTSINYKPPSGRLSNPLEPIHYEEEPTSGAAIKSQMKIHMTSLNQSAEDNLSVVHVREDQSPSSPIATSSDGFFTNSTIGSQSSLIQRSLASEVSSLASAGYHNRAVSEFSTGSATGSRGQRSQPPSASIARPRPNSQGRELSMTSVVLETKL